MRLLRAELRKLRRPLLGWVALGFVAAIAVVAWEGVSNAQLAYRAALRQRAVGADLLASVRGAWPAEHALGAGLLAAGMAASAPGLLALLLLAAAHVGGEWSGHTIKQLLLQEGHRWRVLAAKALSLWLAGVAIMVACWAVLATIAIALAHAYPPPGPTPGWRQALGLSAPQAARALLVLAAFTALAMLAAILTRSPLGTVVLGSLAMLASFELANHHDATKATLVCWVSGWMGFKQRSTYVLFDLWNDHFPGFPAPRLAGLLGLLGVILIAGALALARFTRADVTA
jgi:ABC-type transport system involved in multi-copper enzyme maturation permease subunit